MNSAELWLCDDCTIVAVNGDYSGIETDERVEEVDAGLDLLGIIYPTDDTDEFSWRQCDCCLSPLGGRRTKFNQGIS